MAPSLRAWAVAAVFLTGCASHSEITAPVRSALDAGDPKRAIALLDKELEVATPNDLPPSVVGDQALLVLDRATIQQSLLNFPASERDFQAADKAIDMLDLSKTTGDSIVEYTFSGSSARYIAPPYEKLLINTLNILNYLETGDLEGAKVEARRLAVMERYYKETLKDPGNRALGLAGVLAGFTFERAGEVDEALRYYDDALENRDLPMLRPAVRRLLPRGSYTSPKLQALAAPRPDEPEPSAEPDGTGEIMIVVGYGRVPHKVAKRLPIGLALTYFAGAISPTDAAKANRLAAQGLVTWVNYPSLSNERGGWSFPEAALDRQPVHLSEAVDISAQVREDWKKIEGKIIVSAITRMITRAAVGQGIQAATKDSPLGLLASLAVQGTGVALDTPDTRSWETLPARVTIARLRVAPGHHVVDVEANGVTRHVPLDLAPNGFAVVSLQSLRLLLRQLLDRAAHRVGERARLGAVNTDRQVGPGQQVVEVPPLGVRARGARRPVDLDQGVLELLADGVERGRELGVAERLMQRVQEDAGDRHQLALAAPVVGTQRVEPRRGRTAGREGRHRGLVPGGEDLAVDPRERRLRAGEVAINAGFAGR